MEVKHIMKRHLTLVSSLVLAVGLALPLLAAPAAKSNSVEHRYYGNISDSNCGAHHPAGMSPRQCTLACVKKGAKYVFVYRGKVLAINNQDNPELEKYAGEHVRVEATRKHDALTIASIAPVRSRSRKKKSTM